MNLSDIFIAFIILLLLKTIFEDYSEKDFMKNNIEDN